MRKSFLFLSLVFSFVLSYSFVNAADFVLSKQLELLQSEINLQDKETDKEKSQSRKMILLTNINYLEGSVLKKIKHSESRLEQYKNNLNSSQNGVEIQHWLKKLESTEKKIKDLKDIQFGIGMLKSRILS